MIDRVLISAVRSGRVVQQQASGRVGTTSVGRSPKCDIVLDSGDVSRTHAEICFEDDAFRIHDLGSANGVIIDGARVESAALSSGDVIRIGDFELHITIPTDADVVLDDGSCDDMTIRAQPRG